MTIRTLSTKRMKKFKQPVPVVNVIFKNEKDYSNNISMYFID